MPPKTHVFNHLAKIHMPGPCGQHAQNQDLDSQSSPILNFNLVGLPVKQDRPNTKLRHLNKRIWIPIKIIKISN